MIDLTNVFFAGAERPAPVCGFLQRSTPIGHVHATRPARALRSGVAVVPEQLSPLVRFVLQRSGLDPGSYQTKALHRRVGACLRKLRVPSEDAAIGLLQDHAELVPSILSTVLIGVTGFFRDPTVFAWLRDRVLARLPTGAGARVCSVGCSAGQELYSVAMLLEEQGRLAGSRLLGVDCRTEAIEQAKAGRFESSELEGLSAERLRRHFLWVHRRAIVAPRLRERTEWRAASYSHAPEEAGWDVILCRNVAIYLAADRALRLWERLAGCLQPGGVLVTGHAERPPAVLGLMREASCVYRKPEN